MLENSDIQKLIEAQREIFTTKEDLQTLSDQFTLAFSELQTSLDSYAKKADNYFAEMVMMSHKIDRHEKWLHQVAEKLGVKLEY